MRSGSCDYCIGGCTALVSELRGLFQMEGSWKISQVTVRGTRLSGTLNKMKRTSAMTVALVSGSHYDRGMDELTLNK